MMLHGANKTILMRKKFGFNEGILKGFEFWKIMKKNFIK